MILITHIIIATAVAKPLAGGVPFWGLLIGWASHYLADFIPHWEYQLISLTEKSGNSLETEVKSASFKEKAADYLLVTSDALLGALISFIIIAPINSHQLIYWFLVVLGGILPDFLQFLYYIKKWNFLKPLQTLHNFFHSKIRLKGSLPLNLIGVPLQIIIFAAAAYLALLR